MKKNRIIISVILAINLITIFWWINYYKSNNYITIIEKTEKSLVIIIPEKRLIDFDENPNWILWLDYDSWVWMGFFISSDWKIITANHIIKNNDINYIIKTYDGKEYIAKIISRDEKNDLSVLKINSEQEYPALKILNKDSLINNWDKIISFWVNVNNLENTYVYWKITGTNKILDNVENLIEFFPVVKQGFSGWPIINKNLEVIWINHAISQNKSYGIKLPLIFLQ